MATSANITEIVAEAGKWHPVLSADLDKVLMNDNRAKQRYVRLVDMLEKTCHSPELIDFYRHAYDSAATVAQLNYGKNTSAHNHLGSNGF